MTLKRPAALLFICTMLAGCGLTAEGGDTSDIVIAADLERSGAAAAVGQAYERALRLKIDQINRRGVLGGRKLRLRLTDNRSDKTLSLSNIAEFAADPDVAAIIMGTCSDCVLGAARTINDKRIPTIALAAANEVAAPVAERRYVFKLGPNATDGASALVAEMVRGGVKSVGLLTTEDEYGRNGLDAMNRELVKAGIPVAGRAHFKATDTDVAQPVARVVDERPGAIVVWALPGQATSAAVSARAGGFSGRLYFDSGAAGELFLAGAAATAADGAVMIATQTMAIDDVIAVTPAKAARKQWFRDYTSRYGSYYGYASFAADAIQLIVDAITAVGGTSRERVRDALETSQLDGLSGPIRLKPDNHSGLTPQALTVLVARSGRWRLAG